MAGQDTEVGRFTLDCGDDPIFSFDVTPNDQNGGTIEDESDGVECEDTSGEATRSCTVESGGVASASFRLAEGENPCADPRLELTFTNISTDGGPASDVSATIEAEDEFDAIAQVMSGEGEDFEESEGDVYEESVYAEPVEEEGEDDED